MNEEKIMYNPINGAELTKTDNENIMYCVADNTFYYVNSNEQIIPLKSPINGGELMPTEISGIMYSEYDDILYHVNQTGKITPLQSPINKGELKLTEIPGIMYSEYDDILYHISQDGKIIPLQNPINGLNLTVISSNIFYDQVTGQNFTLNSGRLSPILTQEEYDKISELDNNRGMSL